MSSYDITMCKGEGCKQKDTCLRYKNGIRAETANYPYISWFAWSPATIYNGKWECNSYWKDEKKQTADR